MSARNGRWLSALLGTCLLGTSIVAQGQDTIVRIIQTNSAGTNAHLIDPETNEIVGVIDGVAQAHAAINNPDGTLFYFANERDDTIDVVDIATLEVIETIRLQDRPNKLALNEAYRKIYVGIRDAPLVEVIDLDTHEVIKRIPVLHVYTTFTSRRTSSM